MTGLLGRNGAGKTTLPWIMDGPWYVTWLTSFVLLVLFFWYGMWYGLVYRRWNVVGLVAFIAAQILVALVVIVAVTTTHSWARRRALLHHADGTRADRRAGRARGGTGARRAHHHPPGHGLTPAPRLGPRERPGPGRWRPQSRLSGLAVGLVGAMPYSDGRESS